MSFLIPPHSSNASKRSIVFLLLYRGTHGMVLWYSISHRGIPVKRTRKPARMVPDRSCTLLSGQFILAKRSTALVKLAMVWSASPCSMPSRTQCLMCPSSTTWPHLVQGGLGGVDLGKHILAGHVLVHHPVDGLYLSDDLFQPAVQVICVHTLPHGAHLLSLQGTLFLLLSSKQGSLSSRAPPCKSPTAPVQDTIGGICFPRGSPLPD